MLPAATTTAATTADHLGGAIAAVATGGCAAVVTGGRAGARRGTAEPARGARATEAALGEPEEVVAPGPAITAAALLDREHTTDAARTARAGVGDVRATTTATGREPRAGSHLARPTWRRRRRRRRARPAVSP